MDTDFSFLSKKPRITIKKAGYVEDDLGQGKYGYGNGGLFQA